MRLFSKVPWILGGLAALLIAFVPLPARSHAPTEVTYEINASRFEYLPAEIKVNPGDRVTLKLISTDVVHGLAIDGYDVEMTADPGQTASVSYRQSLTPKLLATVLASGELPAKWLPHVSTMLDEAPAKFIVSAVEEAARSQGVPAKMVWQHLLRWAHELKSPRSAWA